LLDPVTLTEQYPARFSTTPRLVTEHCAFDSTTMLPIVRPAQRNTVALRTVEPTRPVPLTAMTSELAALGALTPIELPEVTVKVYEAPTVSPETTHEVTSAVQLR
jgi:hypothetical protein